MTALDDLRAVIGLACLTEDRSDDEQRALLRVAARVDNECNALTTTNPRCTRIASRLRGLGPATQFAALVDSTRVLDVGQKPVALPAKKLAQLERRAAEWERHRALCESCGGQAEVVLTTDGSLWCIGCDNAARRQGYDNKPGTIVGSET